MIQSVRSQIDRIPRVWMYYREMYRYRLAVSNRQSFFQKFKASYQSFLKLFFNRQNVLFYPDRPLPIFVIYKIFLSLGYHVTTNPSKPYAIAVKWWDNIGSGNPFFPSSENSVFEELSRKYPDLHIVNLKCNDVSKKRVSEVFEKIFGYTLSIDPGTYHGKCVMKANGNGLHLGKILECPTEVRRDGFVYEKLVKNEVENGLVQDMRVPIFKKTIPFVYLKYRPIEERLVDRKHTLAKTVVVKVSDVLSEEEVGKVNQFCEKIGLDYGEIDILRDRDDQKIYIVDVNNDPCGPPSPISGDCSPTAIVQLAEAFDKTFFSNSWQ